MTCVTKPMPSRTTKKNSSLSLSDAYSHGACGDGCSDGACGNCGLPYWATEQAAKASWHANTDYPVPHVYRLPTGQRSNGDVPTSHRCDECGMCQTYLKSKGRVSRLCERRKEHARGQFWDDLHTPHEVRPHPDSLGSASGSLRTLRCKQDCLPGSAEPSPAKGTMCGICKTIFDSSDRPKGPHSSETPCDSQRPKSPTSSSPPPRGHGSLGTPLLQKVGIWVLLITTLRGRVWDGLLLLMRKPAGRFCMTTLLGNPQFRNLHQELFVSS